MPIHHHAKRLGVLTSGGDAPGMNAAVRAVVRTALNRGVKVYAISEGFQGLVDGGERIREADWDAASGILQLGGTVIGTARSKAFRSREGRLQAARHLLEHAIDSLVVIGGDGSLTGAHRLQQEWPELLAALVADGLITQALATRHAHLNVVGLVGSIDNDMPGTDLTIGADTALRRITDAIDAIRSTAASHQRTFVVEVMGAGCGYLALMSGLATGAEQVYLPEEGISLDDLQRDVAVLVEGFNQGRRLGLVIRNEKANPVYTTAFIRALFEEEGRGHFSVHQAILGHLQQGGPPSPFDRILATRLAARGIAFLIEKAGPARSAAAFVGLEGGAVRFHALEAFPRLIDPASQRPREQRWMALRPLVRAFAQGTPGFGPPAAAAPRRRGTRNEKVARAAQAKAFPTRHRTRPGGGTRVR